MILLTSKNAPQEELGGTAEPELPARSVEEMPKADKPEAETPDEQINQDAPEAEKTEKQETKKTKASEQEDVGDLDDLPF